MNWVYILKGSRYYVGSTNNLERRLQEHSRGHTYSTRRIGEWFLIWRKSYPTLAEARAIEKKIKRWKSTHMIQLLMQGKIEL